MAEMAEEFSVYLPFKVKDRSSKNIKPYSLDLMSDIT